MPVKLKKNSRMGVSPHDRKVGNMHINLSNNRVNGVILKLRLLSFVSFMEAFLCANGINEGGAIENNHEEFFFNSNFHDLLDHAGCGFYRMLRRFRRFVG